MEIFGRGDSDPDVRDYARTGNVEEIERGAWRNLARVGVCAVTVVAGDAFLDVVVRLGE